MPGHHNNHHRDSQPFREAPSGRTVGCLFRKWICFQGCFFFRCLYTWFVAPPSTNHPSAVRPYWIGSCLLHALRDQRCGGGSKQRYGNFNCATDYRLRSFPFPPVRPSARLNVSDYYYINEWKATLLHWTPQRSKFWVRGDYFRFLVLWMRA